MTRLLYLANIRLPTEKAHGLQIVQNCEAMALEGADVSLWGAARINDPALRGRDVYAHYGVERRFRLRRLPVLDLLPLVRGRNRLSQVAFALETLTYVLAALVGVLFVRVEIVYSRDALVLFALLPLLRLKRVRVGYEAHHVSAGPLGRRIERHVARRCTVIALTQRLADDLRSQADLATAPLVAHDGIREARFQTLPDRQSAREKTGWPADAFIVGYMGRLQTMAMDKGVGLLVEALASLPDEVALALVGGPDEHASALRERWLALGMDAARFLYAGQVAPDQVPVYLSAFDVCAMPFPWTEHFAHYASPLKLFEYMASGRAVIASDLPSTAEIVEDGVNGLLYPPGDVQALAAALKRLHEDAALRERLGKAGREQALGQFTWKARARRILAALRA